MKNTKQNFEKEEEKLISDLSEERKTLSPKEEKKEEKAKEHTAKVSVSLVGNMAAPRSDKYFTGDFYTDENNKGRVQDLRKQDNELGVVRRGKPVYLSPSEAFLVIFLASLVKKENKDEKGNTEIKLRLNDLCKAMYGKISERDRKAILNNASLVSHRAQAFEYTEGGRLYRYIDTLIKLKVGYPLKTEEEKEEEKKEITELDNRKKELEKNTNLNKGQQAELEKLKIEIQKFEPLKVEEFTDRAYYKNRAKELEKRKKELKTIINRNKEEEAELTIVEKELKEAKERETKLTQIIEVKKTDDIKLSIEFDKIFFSDIDKVYAPITHQLFEAWKGGTGTKTTLFADITSQLLKLYWQYYSAAKTAEKKTRKECKNLSPEALQKEIDEAKKKALRCELTFATIKNIASSDYESKKQYRYKFLNYLKNVIKDLIQGGLITAETTIGKDRVIFYFNEFYSFPKGENELPPTPPTNLLQQ